VIYDFRFTIYDFFRRLALLLFILTLATPSLLQGQQQSVPITDVSPPETPLSVAGNVILITDYSQELPYSTRTDIVITNRSEKPLVFTMVRTEISGVGRANGEEYYVTDHFFYDEFAPHATDTSTSTSGHTGPRNRVDEPHTLAASGKAVFVQFADGSTWGDLKAAREPLCQRERAWRTFRNLRNIYNTSGVETFEAEFTKFTDLIPLRALQYSYAKAKDPQEALERLDRMLATADRQYSNMTDRRFEAGICAGVPTIEPREP
jgi:hypothetical protein